MSKLKSILFVVLAGLVLAGCYHLPETAAPTAQVNTTTQETPVVTGENTISYTGTSFSPQSMTVKPGTTVTFVNDSMAQMWVASALHPTHLELPGFDQLSGNDRGETYSFTFNEVGTWRFHDHLNSEAFGSVIVAE